MSMTQQLPTDLIFLSRFLLSGLYNALKKVGVDYITFATVK